MDTLQIEATLTQGNFRLAVSAQIELAGITAVFGASGSGKTTLLRLIAGLEPEARGSIRYRGTPWLDGARSVPPESRAIGMVFQDGRLFPHLDVAGNLMFPVRHGRRHGAIGFDDTVQALGLADLLHRRTPSLSGGERQRVAIGRALLSGADLLLMDEPLSSLDRERKREILPLIRSLPARFGLPILYVTHDVDELIYLASHVLLQDNGSIVARGGPREIFHGSEFAIVETVVIGHSPALTLARLGDGELRLPRVRANVGDLLRLRIDPRDVILATTPPVGISIRNCLAATVQRIDRRDDGLVSVRLGIGEQSIAACITPDAAADLGLEPEQTTYALIKTVALNAY